jgi:hypothetical protein
MEMGMGMGMDMGLRMKRVMRLTPSRHEEKVTVATQHGSIVANGILVSTLCGDAFKDGEDFEAAAPAWRAFHKIPSPGVVKAV